MRPPKNIFRPNPPPLPIRPVREPPHEAAETERRDAMQEANARAEKNWVLGVTALASFMVALDTQVLTAALATLRADFGAPMEALQWTVNAFNLSFAVLLLTGAALGDRFGRRRLFAAGIALFMVSAGARGRRRDHRRPRVAVYLLDQSADRADRRRHGDDPAARKSRSGGSPRYSRPRAGRGLGIRGGLGPAARQRRRLG